MPIWELESIRFSKNTFKFYNTLLSYFQWNKLTKLTWEICQTLGVQWSPSKISLCVDNGGIQLQLLDCYSLHKNSLKNIPTLRNFLQLTIGHLILNNTKYKWERER